MSERAAKLARIAGWRHWECGIPMCEPEARNYLNPEEHVDDALALAECLWSGELIIGRVSGVWYFEAHEVIPPHYGDTPALAICAAIEAAGEEG